jgi:hypothetical protein
MEGGPLRHRPLYSRGSACPPPISMDVSRNAPCPCGSGLKYKACCAGKGRPGRSRWAGVLVAVAVLGGLLVTAVSLLDSDSGDAPSGKVWSEEHGHWHDAP